MIYYSLILSVIGTLLLGHKLLFRRFSVLGKDEESAVD